MCATTPAIGQALSLSHYIHTAWRRSDLRIPNRIETIAQTPDGYLWFGTATGLFRFDGVRARRLVPTEGQRLPNDDIRALAVSRDGTLWIGTHEGLASWKDDHVTVHHEVPSKWIGSILEDSHGTLRVAFSGTAAGGVCNLRGSTVQCDTLTRYDVSKLFEDRNGTIWAGSAMGIWRYAPGTPTKHPKSPSVGDFGEDDDGNVVIRMGSRFLRVTADSLLSWPLLDGKFGARFFRTRDGALWLTTFQAGVLQLRNGRVEQFSAADGLSDDRTQRAFEDREGNLWVTTETGLDRFRPAVTDVVSSTRGLQNGSGMSVVATPDGSVWIGTMTGLDRWRDTTRTVYHVMMQPGTETYDVPTLADPAKETAALAVHEATVFLKGVDGGGRVWEASSLRYAHFDGARFISADNKPRQPNVVSPGGNGATWLGYEVGLDELLPSGARRVPDNRALVVRYGRVTALLYDPRTGREWVGFFRGELLSVVDGHLTRLFELPVGIPPSPVRHLRLASDGAVWAVLPNGVSRIDTLGRRQTLTKATGLPCEKIDWSYEADDGALWLFGACGLIQISSAEREAWIRDSQHVVRSQVFGEADGVVPRGPDGVWVPISARTADGRIWFVAGDGIEILDPRHVAVNTLPPTARVEEVVADGRTYSADGAAGHRLELPARVRNLEIQYSASSLTVPEKVRFRFKLEGQDPEWREVANERQVAYSNLRPGNYEFRLMASNNRDAWSPVVTALTVHVPPAWNQTWWFFGLIAAAIAAAAASAAAALQHRWARLAAERAQSRFDATLAERTRVARELHDTLLGDMVGVVLQLHAAAKRVEVVGEGAPVARSVADLLTSLREQMERSLGSARRAVTAMREEGAGHPSMVHEQVAAAAERIFAGAEQIVQVASTGSPTAYPPALTADIVGIASEAMTNALRHAQCRTVTVTCQYLEDSLVIAIRDDGRGFEPTQPRPSGHWGLIGMRERASAVGAALVVSSAPGEGTEVSVKVPR